MASNALEDGLLAGSPKGGSGATVYRAGPSLWKGGMVTQILMTVYVVTQALRVTGVTVHEKPEQVAGDIYLLALYCAIAIAIWSFFFYVLRRTSLRLGGSGVTVEDGARPKLFIAWDNMESVDVYTGFSGDGARVAILVKDVDRCLDGLTERQKARALDKFVFGADLICFSTASCKVTAEQFSADAQRLSTIPVTTLDRVDSITVKPEPYQQPPVEHPKAVPAPKTWSRSHFEKVVLVAVGVVFCTLFSWLCLTQKQPDLFFNIAVGTFVALGLSLLVWYWVNSPSVTLDAHVLIVKDSRSKIYPVPLKFISGTRIRISFGGPSASLRSCIERH